MTVIGCKAPVDQLEETDPLQPMLDKGAGTRTDRDETKGRYDYVVARLRLKAAAGTLGEGNIELVNRWLTAAR